MFPNVTPNLDIPYGYCHCGCGQKTMIAPKSHTKAGWIKGQPKRYLHGHNNHPMLSPSDRFWSKVDKSDGEDACWLWMASCKEFGYGQLHWQGGTWKAHRLSYLLTYGDIPDDLWVLHTCDNPPCVNPKHLFLGTSQDNIDDMTRKGRNVTVRGERHGSHKLSDAQVAEIRRRFKPRTSSHRVLAEEFGICSSHVYALVRYRVRAKQS